MKAFIILTVCAVTAFAGLDEDFWRETNQRRPVGIDVFAPPIYAGRIIGGKEVDIKDFPYKLSLRRFSNHICGASVISKMWALSAAHCTENTANLPSYTLFGGSSNRLRGGIVFEVKSIINHPMYNRFNLDYDVSVLQTAKAMVGENIAPIALMSSGVSIEDGTTSLVSGWGLIAVNGRLAENLKAVEIPIVSRETCRSQWGASRITDNMICAGEQGRDSCNGDSGGPLVSKGKQIGVVSWGAVQCGGSFAGVYADLTSPAISDFINRTTVN